MCLNLSPLNLQKAIQMLSVKLGIWRIFKLLIKYLTLQVNAKLSVLLFLWLYGDLYKYWSSVSLLPVQSDPHHPKLARTRGGTNVHSHVRLLTNNSCVLPICSHWWDAGICKSSMWDPNKAGGRRRRPSELFLFPYLWWGLARIGRRSVQAKSCLGTDTLFWEPGFY